MKSQKTITEKIAEKGRWTDRGWKKETQKECWEATKCMGGQTKEHVGGVKDGMDARMLRTGAQIEDNTEG